LEYVYLIMVCVFFSTQFIFYKNYQLRTDGSLMSCAWFALLSGLGSVIAFSFEAPRGFGDDATVWVLALLYAVSFILTIVTAIPAMKLGSMATLTTFTLIGSMLMPFLYGIIWLDEPAGPAKWFGIACIFGSLVPDIIANLKSKSRTDAAQKSRSVKLLFITLCLLNFLGNGVANTIAKLLGVVSADYGAMRFLELSALMRVALALVMIALLVLIPRAKRGRLVEAEPIALRGELTRGVGDGTRRGFWITVAIGGGFSLTNLLGSVSSFLCAERMDSSFQFPVSNAAIIILTMLITTFVFREKFRWNNAAALVLALAGIVLLML